MFRSPSDVKATVAAVVKQFGAVDILMNNAGISIPGDFLEMSEADYDRVLDINLKGSFLMLQACAREMVKQVAAGKPPGAIINMSSVNDTLAIPTIVSYCIAKGGVSQLTRATSISLAPHGIRVNAIGPGSIMTDMLQTCCERQSRHGTCDVAHPHGPRRRAFGDCLHRRVSGVR